MKLVLGLVAALLIAGCDLMPCDDFTRAALRIVVLDSVNGGFLQVEDITISVSDGDYIDSRT